MEEEKKRDNFWSTSQSRRTSILERDTDRHLTSPLDKNGDHFSNTVKAEPSASVLAHQPLPSPPPAPADRLLPEVKDSPIDTSVLDALRALQEEGEPDIVTELIDLFLQDAPLRLESIRAAIAQKDATALRKAAHTLKGSGANLGAGPMATLCFELEKRGRAGSLEGTEVLLAQLEDEFKRVRHALETERR